MLRLVFRCLGVLLLAVAFAALIVDGTLSVAAGAITVLPLGRAATTLAPDAFVKFHTGVETHAPILWDPVLVTLLLMPSWAVIGVFALLLLLAARKPRPKIGYSRR